MAEAKLTTKAVKSLPSRADTAREATLCVPAQQYRRLVLEFAVALAAIKRTGS